MWMSFLSKILRHRDIEVLQKYLGLGCADRRLMSHKVEETLWLVGGGGNGKSTVFEMVKAKGHRLGNHTYNHIGGLLHGIRSYLNNVDKANEYLHTDLFRPPHGWMKWDQYVFVKRRYRVVMWDLVTRDYSTRLNGRDVLRNVRRFARPGSIITFHDSLKSHDKLLYALPRSIEWLQRQGYTFKVFDQPSEDGRK